jgi:hypothetical protein
MALAMKDSHDIKIDTLANNVSKVLDGESCFDAACVCAWIAAFGLATDHSMDQEQRREVFDLVVEFMRKRFDEILQHHGTN